MSDIPALHPLLAAAPLDEEWGEADRVPLAVLPCLRGIDLVSRTAFFAGDE